MSVISIDKGTGSEAHALLASLRVLSDGDANLVLLASQRGVNYRDIAEAWGADPKVIARRLRLALLRMREASKGVATAS